MEVNGVCSRREDSKLSMRPMRACAIRYERSSSRFGVRRPGRSGCIRLPVYLGSSLSSFRRRVWTSCGSSGGGRVFSSEFAAFPSSSFPFSLALSATASVVSVFSFGRGVPDLLGWSSSSPITKSGSNSEGSGPFPAGAALLASPSFDLPGRFEGERLREFDRRGVELDGEREAEARFFAVSSAMRASSCAAAAALMRCAAVSYAVVWHEGSVPENPGTLL
jgi:hypothetical protein